jgi:hypothetical protein
VKFAMQCLFAAWMRKDKGEKFSYTKDQVLYETLNVHEYNTLKIFRK